MVIVEFNPSSAIDKRRNLIGTPSIPAASAFSTRRGSTSVHSSKIRLILPLLWSTLFLHTLSDVYATFNPPVAPPQWPSIEEAKAHFPGCCAPDHFDCLSPGVTGVPQHCIPLQQVHDGVADCADGSDEACFPGQIRCGGYCAETYHLLECLTHSLQCDSSSVKTTTWGLSLPQPLHVQPGTPAAFCPLLRRKLCGRPKTVSCKGYGECILAKWLMDGKMDCLDGSDEDPNYAGLFTPYLQALKPADSKAHVATPGIVEPIVPLMEILPAEIHYGRHGGSSGEAFINESSATKLTAEPERAIETQKATPSSQGEEGFKNYSPSVIDDFGEPFVQTSPAPHALTVTSINDTTEEASKVGSNRWKVGESPGETYAILLLATPGPLDSFRDVVEPTTRVSTAVPSVTPITAQLFTPKLSPESGVGEIPWLVPVAGSFQSHLSPTPKYPFPNEMAGEEPPPSSTLHPPPNSLISSSAPPSGAESTTTPKVEAWFPESPDGSLPVLVPQYPADVSAMTTKGTVSNSREVATGSIVTGVWGTTMPSFTSQMGPEETETSSVQHSTTSIPIQKVWPAGVDLRAFNATPLAAQLSSLNCTERYRQMARELAKAPMCDCAVGELRNVLGKCVRAEIATFRTRLHKLCGAVKVPLSNEEQLSLMQLKLSAAFPHQPMCVRQADDVVIFNTECGVAGTFQQLADNYTSQSVEILPGVNLKVSELEKAGCYSFEINDCDEKAECVPVERLRYTCQCLPGTNDTRDSLLDAPGRHCSGVVISQACKQFLGVCILVWILLLLLLCLLIPILIYFCCKYCARGKQRLGWRRRWRALRKKLTIVLGLKKRSESEAELVSVGTGGMPRPMPSPSQTHLAVPIAAPHHLKPRAVLPRDLEPPVTLPLVVPSSPRVGPQQPPLTTEDSEDVVVEAAGEEGDGKSAGSSAEEVEAGTKAVTTEVPVEVHEAHEERPPSVGSRAGTPTIWETFQVLGTQYTGKRRESPPHSLDSMIEDYEAGQLRRLGPLPRIKYHSFRHGTSDSLREEVAEVESPKRASLARQISGVTTERRLTRQITRQQAIDMGLEGNIAEGEEGVSVEEGLKSTGESVAGGGVDTETRPRPAPPSETASVMATADVGSGEDAMEEEVSTLAKEETRVGGGEVLPDASAAQELLAGRHVPRHGDVGGTGGEQSAASSIKPVVPSAIKPLRIGDFGRPRGTANGAGIGDVRPSFVEVEAHLRRAISKPATPSTQSSQPPRKQYVVVKGRKPVLSQLARPIPTRTPQPMKERPPWDSSVRLPPIPPPEGEIPSSPKKSPHREKLPRIIPPRPTTGPATPGEFGYLAGSRSLRGSRRQLSNISERSEPGNGVQLPSISLLHPAQRRRAKSSTTIATSKERLQPPSPTIHLPATIQQPLRAILRPSYKIRRPVMPTIQSSTESSSVEQDFIPADVDLDIPGPYMQPATKEDLARRKAERKARAAMASSTAASQSASSIALLSSLTSETTPPRGDLFPMAVGRWKGPVSPALTRKKSSRRSGAFRSISQGLSERQVQSARERETICERIETRVHDGCLTDRPSWDDSPLREGEIEEIPLDWNISSRSESFISSDLEEAASRAMLEQTPHPPGIIRRVRSSGDLPDSTTPTRRTTEATKRSVRFDDSTVLEVSAWQSRSLSDLAVEETQERVVIRRRPEAWLDYD